MVDSYIQTVAALEAMLDGYRIVSVSVDFVYPKIQRIEEESVLFGFMREKRRRQFDELTGFFSILDERLKRD